MGVFRRRRAGRWGELEIRPTKAEIESLRQLIGNRWFALIDLLLVMMSAVAWMLIPEFGIWFCLIAILPWVLRFLAGYPPFQRTPFDWLIAIFLVTAWVGYWAAYDKSAAWIKVWLIISAVLLYYALVAQPKQNILILSFISFCFALALSLYFCLTYDFAGRSERIVIWWTNHRPHVDWAAIHPGYLTGLILISAIFAFYWLWNTSKKYLGSAGIVLQSLLVLGTGIVALVFVLTLSGGIEVLVIGAIGLLLLWRISISGGSHPRIRGVFPLLVIGYLVGLVAVAYVGQAHSVLGTTNNSYGLNSRAVLFGRGAYFLAEYPITGAGLASFPGLYSQYILIIPYFYFINSYNLFLDVAIEQGLFTGAIFIILYFGSVVLISRSIIQEPRNDFLLIRWLGLLALLVTIIHGFFYDYLYNGNGTALLLFPIGMAMTGIVHGTSTAEQSFRPPKLKFSLHRAGIGSLLAVIVVLALTLNKIISISYANLGAVQMSQVELQDFPTTKWLTSEIQPRLELADTTLHNALQYDPHNWTANYRLGLIAMLRQDFKTAAVHLQAAHQQAPNHRGIIKSLGYCYVWLGDMDKAQALLDQIPETQHEMEVYKWWWGTQGRPDLSEKASLFLSQSDSASQ